MVRTLILYNNCRYCIYTYTCPHTQLSFIDMNVFLGAKTQEKRSYIRIPKMFMADLEKNYQLVSNYDFTITYTYPMLHRDHLFILCILAGTWTDHYAVERLHQRRLHAGLLQRVGECHWL